MIFNFRYEENDNQELIRLYEPEKIWVKYVDYDFDDRVEMAFAIDIKIQQFRDNYTYIITHKTILDVIKKYNLIKRTDVSYEGIEYNTKTNDLQINIGN
jgi:hypothetical protein